MTGKSLPNLPYRVMLGEPALVTPAWPPVLSPEKPIPLPSRPPNPLDAIYGGQPKASFLYDIAHDAVEDIAILRSHRVPEPHESWRDPDRAEQRLLNQIDAAVNCGSEAVERLLKETGELGTPDPDWVYAIVLVVGALRGEDAPRRVLKLLRDSANRDPQELEAVVEALCLVPHPDIERMLIALIADASPTMRRAAVQVVSYKGGLPDDVALRLLSDPAPEVTAAALEGINISKAPSALKSVRGILNHGNEGIARAAMRVLFRAGVPGGRERALSFCSDQPEFGEACLLVGLSGVQSDFSILERLLIQRPSPMIVRAAGYFGDLRLVPRLIELLKEDNTKPQAAKALERITGAGLKSQEPGPPQQIEEPDPWTKWWDACHGRFSADRRHRLGRPYGPSALVDELDNSGDRTERLRAYLEICRLAGLNAPRFHPLDFIPKQAESMQTLRQWAGANPGLDGGRWSSH
jgi:HEAT repeat protein